MDAVKLLKDDHTKVKGMFRDFEKAKSTATKVEIVRKAMLELKVHSQIEEEIFYPAMDEVEGLEELMHEADEEHHVVDLLMDELAEMSGDEENFEAKFTVLIENVEHHIEEEETEMLPKSSELDKSLLDELGDRMAARKTELLRQLGGEVEAPKRSGAASRGANPRRSRATSRTAKAKS